MDFAQSVRAKIIAARELILGCISPLGMGIWADQHRYANNCWTRDAVIAAFPALMDLCRHDVVVNHLQQLARRQSREGKIPILFLDDEKAWLRRKIGEGLRRAAETGDARMRFMLDRYLEAGGVEDLSPWTKDSELLYLIGAEEWLTSNPGHRRYFADSLQRAWRFLGQHRIRDEFIFGGDWRDTQRELDDKALLVNNAFLYRYYVLAGETQAAQVLRDRINADFWNGEFYVDYVGANSTDTFGQALAVLYGIVPSERYPSVMKQFELLNTPYGYMTNNCPPNPTTDEERRLLTEMPQSFVIWPFIHGFAARALHQMGEAELALRAFEKYTALDGFWEWHDPNTGKGYGSPTQLWTAALYLRVARVFGYSICT